MKLIEPNTAVPDTLQGRHWIGLPHTREQWAVLRQKGMWRYILRSSMTWVFFVIMGVINPALALLIMGTERGTAYALPGVIGGVVGGIWISRTIWKKCERAWHAEGHH